MELKGKTALITGSGAGGGIGAATARLFAGEGAHVIVSGRDAERGEQVVAEIAADGGSASFVVAELSDVEAVRRLAEQANDADILVNNAAIFPGGPTPEQDVESLDQTLAINVRAPYLLTAALAPKMIARGGGSIVNISTMVARIGMPGLSIYGASKSALESLTRTWAAEFASGGVRVNVVAPGPTRSEKVTEVMGEAAEQLGQSTPLARMASPAEIAQVVLFLASERASYITGATLAADGGRTAI